MSDYITKIDDKLLSYFNADLVDYTVSQNDLTDNMIVYSNSVIPVPLKGAIGTKTIKLVLDFKSVGSKKSAKTISEFVNYLAVKNENHDFVELHLRDGFYYTCCFKSADDPVEKAPWILQSTFTFVGFRHTNKIEQTFTSKSQGAFDNDYPHCDIETPIYIKVTPLKTVDSFTLTVGGQAITFSGISEYVEIDSLRATVTDKKGNAFGKCNMTAFPKYQGNSLVSWKSTVLCNVTMRIFPIVF